MQQNEMPEKKDRNNVPELEEVNEHPEVDKRIHKPDYDIDDQPDHSKEQADKSVDDVVRKDMQQRRESQQKDGPGNINVQGTSER